ncbi:major histocompatibility complex, class I, E (human) [Squirrelpox virus]|uniref:I2L n=1 Tax=Squirrelpox virus TaxID=240426 RepID=Q1HTU8_9POXV|nr:major histocompatibility complex, class I, E (human) [Squirrelpox virus]ABD51438.1 I2L [Squirrelpox virus]CCD83187.1 major histocompatibility complex, class I, E (human) [Squirrelpox virus]
MLALLILLVLSGLRAALAAGGCRASSLVYHHVGLTTEATGDHPRYLVVGYVDDTEIVRFDSNSTDPRVVASVPWNVTNETKYWTDQNKNARETQKIFRLNMRTMSRYYNHTGGSHVLQWSYGCSVTVNCTRGGAHEAFAYDGEDYMTLNEDLRTWTAVSSHASLTMKSASFATDTEFQRSYLTTDCVEWLGKHLAAGGEHLRVVPPRTNLTYREVGGAVELRCWAREFYPSAVSITWLHDSGEPVNQTSVEVRPDGAGTFQKWAAVVVTAGTETEYACRVTHNGESWTLRRPGGFSVLGTVLLVVAVLIALILAAYPVYVVTRNHLAEHRRVTTLEYENLFVVA